VTGGVKKFANLTNNRNKRDHTGDLR